MDRKGAFARNMPKIRTNKTAAKRFKVTGSGKLRRRKARATHLRRKKSKRSKRQLAQDVPVSKADRKRVRRILQLEKR
jgi:large subunit ribosomal protein L35